MPTFRVAEVNKAKKALPRGKEDQIVLERCGSVKPEARSTLKFVPFEKSGSYEPLENAFIAAVHTAFANHYPLVLTPDAIWLVIAQGFAFHVNANAEDLRKKFVDHEGQKTLEVRVDNFVKGSPHNPWEGALHLFSNAIRENIGEKTYELLNPSFSTTGPVERAAANIVLMNTFKEYFLYQLVCICGIPEVTLEGTPEDWVLLRKKALALGQFDLEWWTDELKPILDQFVDAASGKVDVEFWRRIYKLNHAYGTYMVNGWIVDLFPYIGGGRQEQRKNPALGKWRTFPATETKDLDAMSFGRSVEGELSMDSFPLAVVSAPFVWVASPDKKYDMKFFGGFMAATQDPETLAIHAEIGWAVADAQAEKEAEFMRGTHDVRF